MITMKRVGQWGEMAAIAGRMQVKWQGAIEKALLAEAELMRGHIIRGLANQAPGGQPFAPISPFTKAVRKVLGGTGSKALIATNAMRGSIAVKRISSGSNAKVFVGVLGAKQALKARVHEFGATITKTDRMNRFLHAVAREAGVAKEGVHVSGVGKVFKDKQGRWHAHGGKFLSGKQVAKAKAAEAAARSQRKSSGAGKGVIVIPARPFIQPVIANYMKPAEVRARFRARLAEAMGGDFGKVSGMGFNV